MPGHRSCGRTEQQHPVTVRPVTADPAGEDARKGIGIANDKRAVNDDIDPFPYCPATNDVAMVELGDARGVAIDTDGRGCKVGKPVEIYLFAGREGADSRIRMLKSAGKPGVHLGMPFPHCSGRCDVVGETDDRA